MSKISDLTATLTAEHKQAEEMLAKLQANFTTTQQNLLRIEGALKALELVSAEEPTDAAVATEVVS